MYKRNRYYDPNTGRFTQEDPIGLAGGLNLYGFAGGDPVNFSDPFGLCKQGFEDVCAKASEAKIESMASATSQLGAGCAAMRDDCSVSLWRPNTTKDAVFKGAVLLAAAGGGFGIAELAAPAAVAAAAGGTFLPEGGAVLVAIQDGRIVAQTANLMTSHAQLARVALGSISLPPGAWIGTVGKVESIVSALNSYTFYGNQGAAPAAIQALVRMLFH
jgi:hypothetical protein